MNQNKIGRLIAELRKEQNLTQEQLAEKLNITDKAISKWERGKSMPDVSILNDLSKILHVTTTEILEGKRISIDSYHVAHQDTEFYHIISKELLLFLNTYYQGCSIYFTKSKDSNYIIEGLVVIPKDKIYIMIHSVKQCLEEEISDELIYCHEYSFHVKHHDTYQIGNIQLYEHKENNQKYSLNAIFREIKLYMIYLNEAKIYKDIIHKNMFIQIRYINQYLEIKELKIDLDLCSLLLNNQVI